MVKGQVIARESYNLVSRKIEAFGRCYSHRRGALPFSDPLSDSSSSSTVMCYVYLGDALSLFLPAGSKSVPTQVWHMP